MKKIIFNVYAVTLAMLVIYATVLMTEPGQAMAIAPRGLILFYFEHFWFFITMQVIAFAGLIYLNRRWSIWKPIFVQASAGGVIVAAWLSMNIMPTVFPTVQYDSNYYSVNEATLNLEDSQRVYVVEVGEEVRIFPQTHVEIPHVAGWNTDGTDYAITYCGLSNLPMVIESDYGYGESDLKILTQVSNNLIFKDSKNGNAVQHITMQSEIAESSPTVVPNTMMTWSQAKTLYPDAQVFLYGFDGMLDPLMAKTFETYLIEHKDPEKDFLFKTVKNDDQRMNKKVEIFGYDNGESQVAIHPDYALNNNGEVIEVGSQKVYIETDGQIVRLRDAETHQQLPIHNGVHFGIWAEFFPETDVVI